jgi:hypothetical protein
MFARKWKFGEAYNFVQEKRPIISPNYGFREQLSLFEEMNYQVNLEHEKCINYITAVKEKQVNELWICVSL